jgi:hypothetical protein
LVHDIKDAMLLNSAVGTIFNELEKLRKSSKENQVKKIKKYFASVGYGN